MCDRIGLNEPKGLWLQKITEEVGGYAGARKKKMRSFGHFVFIFMLLLFIFYKKDNLEL